MAVRSARPSSGEGRWPSAFPGGFPANRTTGFAGKPYFEVYLIESTSCIRYASGRSIKLVDYGFGLPPEGVRRWPEDEAETPEVNPSGYAS